jgi:hypothetical protein
MNDEPALKCHIHLQDSDEQDQAGQVQRSVLAKLWLDGEDDNLYVSAWYAGPVGHPKVRIENVIGDLSVERGNKVLDDLYAQAMETLGHERRCRSLTMDFEPECTGALSYTYQEMVSDRQERAKQQQQQPRSPLPLSR